MRLIVLVVLVFLLAIVASAGTVDPLQFTYSISPLEGGVYEYRFSATNDSLPSGTGVGWVMFGVTTEQYWDGIGEPEGSYDVGQFGRLAGGGWWEADFLLTSPVPGPWTEWSLCGGSFNGPTFTNPLDLWFPNVGDSIVWSGTSSRDLSAEGVKFAFMTSDSDYVLREQDGVSVTPTPEPGMFWAWILACAGLLGLRLLKERG